MAPRRDDSKRDEVKKRRQTCESHADFALDLSQRTGLALFRYCKALEFS